MARSKPPKKPAPISKPPETDAFDLDWSSEAFAGKRKPTPIAEPAPVIPPALDVKATLASEADAEPAPDIPPVLGVKSTLASEPDWTEDDFFGAKKASPAAEPKQQAPAQPLPAEVDPKATLAFGSMGGDALELVSGRAAAAPLEVQAKAPGSASLDEVRSRFDVGDCSGALLVAESILEADPENVEALQYVEKCREVLQKMYLSRLGGLNRIPQVVTSAEQMRWLSLDHRAGFVLSLIDGTCTFDEILDMSGMRRLDALRILFDLLQQNVINVV